MAVGVPHLAPHVPAALLFDTVRVMQAGSLNCVEVLLFFSVPV